MLRGGLSLKGGRPRRLYFGRVAIILIFKAVLYKGGYLIKRGLIAGLSFELA